MRIGTEVTIHYAMTLEDGKNLEQIAQEYGTMPDSVLAANGYEDPTQPRHIDNQRLPMDMPLPGSFLLLEKTIMWYLNNQNSFSIIAFLNHFRDQKLYIQQRKKYKIS